MRIWLKFAAYFVVVVCFSSARAGSYEDFFIAINRDDGRTVGQLLERGFDPNSRDPKGQTGLILALRDDSLRVAEALWKSPALDVNVLNPFGENALMMAALRGQFEWSKRLLEIGALVHKEGWSPIHYAATGPEVRIVALLLDRGAPVEAMSPDRDTPLMMAARYGSEASVDLLLARGASTAAKNERQIDAAEHARMGGRDYLVERLQKNVKR